MQEINNNKLFSLIGFSIKSNGIIYGFDNIKTTRKKMFLIIACNLATEKNINKLKDLCDTKNIAFVKLKELNLANVTFKDNVKFIALTNYELAKTIFSLDENFEIIKRGIFIG